METQKLNVPVNSGLLFKHLGEAEYKIKLYEATMTQQAQQIKTLTEQLEKCKCKKDEPEKKDDKK